MSTISKNFKCIDPGLMVERIVYLIIEIQKKILLEHHLSKHVLGCTSTYLLVGGERVCPISMLVFVG